MYRILASLRADMNEGWVWLGKTRPEPRATIRIKNKTNGKKIYCESLEIDNNYLYEYNDPSRHHIEEKDINAVIIMNGWYRKKLGNLETNREYDLEVEEYNTAFGRLCASLDHPQIVARVATKLGLWSVLLGLLGSVGVILSVVPYFKK